MQLFLGGERGNRKRNRSRGGRGRRAWRRRGNRHWSRARSRRGHRHSGTRRRSHSPLPARQPVLQLLDPFGQGLEREVALGTSRLRERDLQHEALVHRRAHLACRVAQNREHAGQTVRATIRGGLPRQLGLLVGRRVHHAGPRARDGHHVRVAYPRRKLACELQQVSAGIDDARHLGKERRHVARGQRLGHARHARTRDLAQEVARRRGRDLAVAKDAQLLQRGDGVAHAAARVANHEVKGLVLIREALLVANLGQVGMHLVVADGMEVEALHTRQDRGENLLRVGGAHDEHHVRRRLFEGLEQRVEGRRGQHVDLIDDVDLVAATHRREVDAVDDLLAHVVDARAAGRVELVDVGVVTGGDEPALLAGAVGQVARALLALERLGEDACHGGLSGAARTTEQVRVARAVLGDGALKRGDHVALANDVLERLRAVLAIQRLHEASGYALRAGRGRHAHARGRLAIWCIQV